MSKKPDVSWRPPFHKRQFGFFIRWDGKYALIRSRSGHVERVHKSNVSFEVG